MEKNMEHEMDTREYVGVIVGVTLGLCRDNGKMETTRIGYVAVIGYKPDP